MTNETSIQARLDRIMWCGFTDRASYIEWRTEWRKLNSELSLLIRKLRIGAAYASQRRASASVKHPDYDVLLAKVQAEVTADRNLNPMYSYFNCDYWKHHYRGVAKAMMAVRKNSKEKARDQYLSAKSLKATALPSQPHNTATLPEASVRVAV